MEYDGRETGEDETEGMKEDVELREEREECGEEGGSEGDTEIGDVRSSEECEIGGGDEELNGSSEGNSIAC
jgi:hypothetical protein